jgi:hypothetical protein
MNAPSAKRVGSYDLCCPWPTTRLSSRVVRDRPMKNMTMEMTWVMASPCDQRASHREPGWR